MPRRTAGFLRLTSLRGLRRHPLRVLLAVLTVASGVGIIVAIAVELGSVQESLDRFGSRLAGPAPLRVVGPTTRGGVDSDAVSAIAAADGVSAAIPMIRAVTEVEDADGVRTVLALGLDCRAERLLGDFGCREDAAPPPQPGPAGPSTATLTAGSTVAYVSSRLAEDLGSSPVLRTNTGNVALAGAQPVAELDDVNEGRVVVVPLPVADQVFARQGRVDVVYVFPGAGDTVAEARAALTGVLGPAYAVLDAKDPPAGFDATGILMPLLGVFALVGLGVGGLLVYQVVTLSVAERRRDLAVSAALGAPPRLIAVGFLGEAFVVGILGALVGTGVGILLARPLVASASTLTEQFLGVAVTPVIDPAVLGVGLATGVLTALGAALLPSRRATRVDLAGEISGRSTRAEDRPRSTWRRAGLLALVGGGAVAATHVGTLRGGLTSWQPTLTRLGLVVAIASLFALAGALAPNLVRIAAGPLRARTQLARHARQPDRPATPAALSVAMVNLVGDARRTSSLATAVAVPVATAGLLSGLLLAVERGSVDVTEVAADGRAVVTTTRFSDYGPIEAKVSPDTLTGLQSLPQTARLDRVTEIEVGFRSGDLVYVQAQEDPTFPYAILAGDPGSEVVARGEIVVGAMLARQRGLEPGDTLRLPTLRGLHDWRIGAVWADPQSGGRTVLMPLDEAERYFGEQPSGLVMVTPAAGVGVGELVAAVRGASFDQPVQVRDPAGYGAEVAAETSRFLRPFNALQAGLLAVAFISVFSTLLLVGIQRRRETATISALGATPKRIVGVVVLEAVVAGTAGALLGAVVTVGVLDAVGQDAVIDVGMLPPFQYPLGTVAGYGTLAVVVAAVAAQLPGWQATRIPLAPVLRDE